MQVDETPEPDYRTLSRDIQELQDEQRPLREEQDRWPHQGNGSNGNHTDTKREPSEQDARKNQRDGQNEPKEQPKPPLKEHEADGANGNLFLSRSSCE